MILVALGANLCGSLGPPRTTLAAVPQLLQRHNAPVVAASQVYVTVPVGPGGQNPYLNAVVAIASHRPPHALLAVLKRIEALAGRRAGIRWGARALDLDLIAYHDVILGTPDVARPRLPTTARRGGLILPHPRLAERPFVVRPLLDVAPFWHHPVSGESAAALWRRLRLTPAGRVIGALGPL